MQKLKVGDTVQVISGAEKSAEKTAKRGKIIEIDREAGRVRVEGLRMVTRHVKKGADRDNPDGGKMQKPGTIALSSVQVVCPKCDKATRVGIKLGGADGKGKSVRVCKSCEAELS
jgi:large subunit ribosomal protein L24